MRAGEGGGRAIGALGDDKGRVDTGGTHTRAQVASARRRSLGGGTGYCQKRGGQDAESKGPARPGRVGRPAGAAAVDGRAAVTLGAEKGRPAGGVAGWLLLGVGGPREVGGAVWGAGPGPVLTMPGRSAYLGSAMAAARRGWGAGERVGRGGGRGWVRVPGSGGGRGSGGGAGSLATGAAARQKREGGDGRQAEVARTRRPPHPWSGWDWWERRRMRSWPGDAA